MSKDAFNGNQPSYRKTQVKLYEKCHDYLVNNFSKFSDANKIKVALAIVQKLIPQEVNNNMVVNMMPTIKTEDGKDKEFNLGTPRNPETT